MPPHLLERGTDAFTSVVGRLRMKPTVCSATRAFWMAK